MQLIDFFFISLTLFSIISFCIVFHLNFDTSNQVSPNEKVKILRDLRLIRVSKLNLKPILNKNVTRGIYNTSTSQKNIKLSTPACDGDDYNRILFTINLEQKMRCLSKRNSSIYLYHMRKTAGTLLRNILELSSRKQYEVKFYESEGQVLNPNFLNQYGIITAISLRQPVDRIISLYWYEHVLYYYNVQKKPGKTSNLLTWITAWRDNSPWKQNYTRQYPGNVYVEVENYYVKALSGWNGTNPIDETDLAKAKEVLQQFDLLFLVEYINTDFQDDVVRAFIKSSPTYKLPKRLTTDKSLIRKLRPFLAQDESDVRAILTEINKYDLELFEYAKVLLQTRLPAMCEAIRISQNPLSQKNSTFQNECLHRFLNKRNKTSPSIFIDSKQEESYHRILSLRSQMTSDNCRASFTQPMTKTLGFIRHIGHKQPVNIIILD